MCGIFGFTKYTASPKQLVMSTQLLCMMTDRGKQSWGTTDGVGVKKFCESALVGEWPESHLFDTSLTPMGVLLGHTRAASHGGVTTENAHPYTIIADDATSKIIGVHNGTVEESSMVKHNKKNYQVDSQMLLDMLLYNKDTSDIGGTGVLVYVQNETNLRFLRFNSTNLYVVKDLDTGGLIWASTKSAVETVTKATKTITSSEIIIKPETIYEVREGKEGHELYEVGPKAFGSLASRVFTHNSGHEYFDHWNNRDLPWGQGRTKDHHKGQNSAAPSSSFAVTKCSYCQIFRPNPKLFGVCNMCAEYLTVPNIAEFQDTWVWAVHHNTNTPVEVEVVQ